MSVTFYKLFLILTGTISVLLLSQPSFAQKLTPLTANASRRFQGQELQQDFLVLRRVLEEAHAGLYRYTDRKTLDARFDDTFKALNHEMTERDFYRIVVSVLSAIKDGHTGSLPSRELMSHFGTLPLKLRFIKERAYVVSSPNNVIAPGSELLFINRKRTSDIARAFLPLLEGDGDIETSKYWRLNRRFGFYYNLFIEQPGSFDVEYYDPARKKRLKTRVSAIIEDEGQALADTDDNKEKLWLEFLPQSRVALLTIKTFADELIKKAGQDYRTFLEAAFQRIKAKNIQNLIIDLRGNGGGEDEFGALLFAYLTDKEFRYYERLETSTDKISLAKFVNSDPERDRMFAEDLLPGVAGRFRLKASVDSGLQKPQPPQPNHFDGKVWCLVNGASFSATAEFSSVAHYHRRATFVGEEVGGSYYGNTSGYEALLTLPNTKIRVSVPLWEYVLAVSGYAYPRHGVMPDYPVEPTIQDVLSGFDVQLNYTLRLIKNGK